MNNVGLLLLSWTHEATQCLRKWLMRHSHVTFAKLQCLNQKMRRTFKIFERNTRGVFAGNWNTLEVWHKVMFINWQGIVLMHLGCSGMTVDFHYSAKKKNFISVSVWNIFQSFSSFDRQQEKLKSLKMDFCNTCEPCEPCKTVCEPNWNCRIVPCPSVFVDSCSPCDSNVYMSPICNENLLLTGVSNCEFLFCTQGSELRTYLPNLRILNSLNLEKMKLYVADDWKRSRGILEISVNFVAILIRKFSCHFKIFREIKIQ